jgi:hypothetical protein
VGKIVGWLVLEVIDQGKTASGARRERAMAMAGAGASPEETEPESVVERVGSGGLGLMLVNGLVTRELGGAFARMRGRDRGTVARVEIPVSAEEAGGRLAAGQ